MDRICYCCKKSISLFNASVYLLKDGYYCYDCMKNKGIDLEWFKARQGNEFGNLTCEEFSKIVDSEGKTRTEYINYKNSLRSKFSLTKKIGEHISIDDNNKIFKLDSKIYEYNQILKYELLEDNSTVINGGIGRAIVGDMLFGATGALIGATTRKSKDLCNNLEILISLKDEYHPTESIRIITDSVKRNSYEYERALQTARLYIGMFDNIVHGNVTVSTNDSYNFSAADEIRKFKGLLDDGIITQEEFEKKKYQLLNLNCGNGIATVTCEKANEQIPEKINEPIKEIAKVEAKIEQPTVAKKIERKELSEEDVANRISTITIIVISILVVTLVTIAIMLLLK